LENITNTNTNSCKNSFLVDNLPEKHNLEALGQLNDNKHTVSWRMRWQGSGHPTSPENEVSKTPYLWSKNRYKGLSDCSSSLCSVPVTLAFRMAHFSLISSQSVNGSVSPSMGQSISLFVCLSVSLFLIVLCATPDTHIYIYIILCTCRTITRSTTLGVSLPLFQHLLKPFCLSACGSLGCIIPL